jgi:hypothetical protein
MILTFSRILLLQMARTKRTARKSTGGKVPRHQLAPREPRPEPTEVERLRAELAEVTATRNAARQQLEQVIYCNTPGVYHQLGRGFELKHDKLVEMTMPKPNLWK